MALATFRFYEELNNFLAPNRRKREFDYDCAQAATVKRRRAEFLDRTLAEGGIRDVSPVGERSIIPSFPVF